MFSVQYGTARTHTLTHMRNTCACICAFPQRYVQTYSNAKRMQHQKSITGKGNQERQSPGKRYTPPHPPGRIDLHILYIKIKHMWMPRNKSSLSLSLSLCPSRLSLSRLLAALSRSLARLLYRSRADGHAGLWSRVITNAEETLAPKDADNRRLLR